MNVFSVVLQRECLVPHLQLSCAKSRNTNTSLYWSGCLLLLSILNLGSVWARAEASAGHTLHLVESHQLPLCEEDQAGDAIPQRRRLHDHAGELTHTTQQHLQYHLFSSHKPILCLTCTEWGHIYILWIHVNMFYSNTSGSTCFPSGSATLLTSILYCIFYQGLPWAGKHSRLQFGVRLRTLWGQGRFQRAAGPAVAPSCPPPLHKVFQVRSGSGSAHNSLDCVFKKCFSKTSLIVCFSAFPVHVLKLPTSPR